MSKYVALYTMDGSCEVHMVGFDFDEVKYTSLHQQATEVATSHAAKINAAPRTIKVMSVESQHRAAAAKNVDDHPWPGKRVVKPDTEDGNIGAQ